MNLRIHHSLTALAVACLCTAAFGYDVAPVAGGGRVEGKVTFVGEVGVRKIVPNKDVEVCGGPRDEVRINIAADKGVREAVVYLKAVQKGKDWGELATKQSVLDQEKCTFKPVVQLMRPGKLDVVNSDPVLHTSHGYYGARGAFNIAMPEKGMKVGKVLSQPGMIRVQCDTHNWMHSHIYIADSPYYVMTGADGSFSITDVPPGTYTVVASHPYPGNVETMVTVKGGEAVKLAIVLKKE